MRFVHLSHDNRLSGFLRPAHDLRFGNLTLREHVQQAASANGWQVQKSKETAPLTGPALVVRDDVYISPRAMRALKKVSRRQLSLSKASRLFMAPCRLNELLSPLQSALLEEKGLLFDVAFLPEGLEATSESLFKLGFDDAFALPFKELLVDVPQPRFILQQERDSLTFPFTTSLVMQVRHWVHALRLSHFLPQILLLEKARSQPLRSLLRSMRSLRLSKESFLAALKINFAYRGHNVVIHPSAVVEASIIGDNVRIGPHASVIGSIVGDGVIIEDRVHVYQSILGPKSFLSRNSSMSACLIMGNTDACANGIQACVVDEEVGLTSFARPLDLSLIGQVKVIDEGKLVDAGELPCGVFFSRGAFIGGGVTIGSGRVVPPGLSLIAGGETVFRTFPSDEECNEKGCHTWTLSGGRLTPVPLSSSKKPSSLS